MKIALRWDFLLPFLRYSRKFYFNAAHIVLVDTSPIPYPRLAISIPYSRLHHDGLVAISKDIFVCMLLLRNTHTL